MATRADRNNNPGNLRPGVGRVIWQGQSGTDSDGFAVFINKDAGIRAADLNLQSYGNHGYHTVKDIIDHWSTTDQAAYENSVANGLGVSPTAALDLSNPQVRQGLLAQIFNFEGSGTRYSSGPLSNTWEDIQKAVESGNPFDILGAVAGAGGTLVDNITSNVIGSDASTAIGGAVDKVTGAVSNAFHFDLGQWLTDQATGAAKNFIVPLAIGAGALILIMLSSWGLVKDTPAGTVVKSGARAAATVAMV